MPGVRMSRVRMRVARVRSHRGDGSRGTAGVTRERVVRRVRFHPMLPRGCSLLPCVSFRFVLRIFPLLDSEAGVG